MDLSSKHVRVIDNGLFVSFARKIAPAFGKLDYYCPYQSYCPKSNQLCVGDGFDEMERIKFPLQDADKVDLWIFLDIYHCDMQSFLIERGARVWGARYGEELELYRWEFKQLLKKIGLPVQHCEHIVGIDKLRTYLRDTKDKYVKTSFVRGDFETFRHENYILSEPRLDELVHVLGPLKDNYEFIVEDEIPDAVEVGYDGFTIDGEFPSHGMVAYEIKDVGMIGTVKAYDKLPKPVLDVNSKLSSTFRDYNYRGFLCTEIRFGARDRKPYLIDPCCRLGSPSNELLQELFDGWPDTLWHGAAGETKSPREKFKFAVAAVIHCEWGTENWVALHYPKEIDQWVKLRFHTKVDGVNYTAPQPVGLPAPGVVLGVGKTLLEAIAHCKENADQVKGYQVEVTLESIDKALGVIEKGQKMGIEFSRELPTVEQVHKVLG